MKQMKVLLGLIQGLALLILVSCEEPGRIGVDIDPDDLTFNTIYKKFSLSARLVQRDSIVTSGSTRLLVGRYSNPDVGKVEVKSYFQVWQTSRPSIPDGAIYDSMLLVLPYSYLNGVEVFEENTINVYRLEEDLLSFGTYYSTNELARGDEPIGTSSFFYNTTLDDSEEVIDLDTTMYIKLSDDLGEEIFNKALDESDSTFETLDNWLAWFKGLSLEPGDQFSSVTGFNQASSVSNMAIYYHYENDEGEDVNSNILFSIENSEHFNNIAYDRTGSMVDNGNVLYTEYDSKNGFIYTQSATGLVAKVDFSPFQDYADSVGELVVNYGRLTFGEVAPYGEYSLPPSSLIFYYTDSTNLRLFDEDTGLPRTIQLDGPTYDATGSQNVLSSNFIFEGDDDSEDYPESYSSTISNTLQAMSDGLITESKIMTGLTPTGNAASVNWVKIDPQNITLEVYYTTSKESGTE